MEKGTPYREQFEDKADKSKAEETARLDALANAADRINKAPRPPGLHYTPGPRQAMQEKIGPLGLHRTDPDGEAAKAAAQQVTDRSYGPGKDIKAELAAEAVQIVTGARCGAYGTPESNFGRIAAMWNAYFECAGYETRLTARDVSPMMRLMKEARLCESPDHRDSFVDLIGYALTGAEINGVE